LCVSPVAFPLTTLVPAGRTHGQLDLLARRKHDERRGAVSVLPIPLSFGRTVSLPPCPSACGTESGEPPFAPFAGLVVPARLPPAGGALCMEPQVRRVCLLLTAPSSVARPPSFVTYLSPASCYCLRFECFVGQGGRVLRTHSPAGAKRCTKSLMGPRVGGGPRRVRLSAGGSQLQG
jgi:hypothetical protein